MDNDERTTYTIPEVAKILRIGKVKAYELAKLKEFPVIKIGRNLRVPIAPFNDWLNKCN